MTESQIAELQRLKQYFPLEAVAAEQQRLDSIVTTIRAYCIKSKLDGWQHVPISTILELLSNR